LVAEVAYGARATGAPSESARAAGAPSESARAAGGSTPARPALRLAPLPVAAGPSRRDFAYAVALGLVLAIGVLGVLVLNTLMQAQARTIAAQRTDLAALSLRQQTVQLQLDAADNPRELARRAQALHMRPAGLLTPLTPPPRGAKPPTGSAGKPTTGSAGKPTTAAAGKKPGAARISGRGRGTPTNRAG
jgi:type II secretory pathway pseudopilin PulG